MPVDIPGYEGLYRIDKNGNIYSVRKNKVMSPGTYPNGYRFVCLSKDGIHKTRMIHRLVAETFLLNHDPNKTVVNHLDGNKKNNKVSNLEWCTSSENCAHAISIGLVEHQCKIRRPVTIVSLYGVRKEFPDIKSCCDYFGHTKSWLGNYIRKRGNPCHYAGYTIQVHERRWSGSHENSRL